MKKQTIEALKIILIEQDRLLKSLEPVLEKIEAHAVYVDRVRRFPDQYARGLLEAAFDNDAALLELYEKPREDLIKMLKENYGIDYQKEVVGVKKMASKIIKRGVINNNSEYRILVEYRDSLGDTKSSIIGKANYLLYSYEKTKMLKF